MKYIVFDLDGTLTDSGEGILHCAELTLAHFGLSIPSRAEMRFMVGPPLMDSFRRFGIPEQELENAVAYYRKHYLSTGQYENAPYPGIRQLLENLRQDGHCLCVATSKPETMAIQILQNFGLASYFTHICGAASDHSRSTKEAVIGYLLEKLPAEKNVIMVGDTVYDVRGAAYHGIPCVAVSWGYGAEDDFLAAGVPIAHSMEMLYEQLQ